LPRWIPLARDLFAPGRTECTPIAGARKRTEMLTWLTHQRAV